MTRPIVSICQSTEVGWLVIQIALDLTRLTSACYNNTTCRHMYNGNISKQI